MGLGAASTPGCRSEMPGFRSVVQDAMITAAITARSAQLPLLVIRREDCTSPVGERSSI